MDILTEEAYDQQLKAAITASGTQSFRQNGFDEEFRVRDQFGTTWWREVELRPGLEVLLVRYNSHRDLNFWSYQDSEYPLTATFRLSGAYRALILGHRGLEENLEVAGYHYWFYQPNIELINQWFADHDCWDFLFWIDPDLLRQYCAGSESLPAPVQTLVEQGQLPRFFQEIGLITPPMLALLQQIWLAPFQPPMQRLHLESCVLQLLVLQLNQWLQAEQGICRVKELTPAEIDKIYQARDLLIRHADEPSSPIDLAQSVELSDRKLQKGFRQVFGTTVFGYLHDYRMEQAKMLLCDRAISVAMVANTISYTHLSHFAAAFKKKFGVSPKAWQQTKTPGF